MFIKVGDHLETLGFSDPEGRACSPSPGTVPLLKLVGFLFPEHMPQKPCAQLITGRSGFNQDVVVPGDQRVWFATIVWGTPLVPTSASCYPVKTVSWSGS